MRAALLFLATAASCGNPVTPKAKSQARPATRVVSNAPVAHYGVVEIDGIGNVVVLGASNEKDGAGDWSPATVGLNYGELAIKTRPHRPAAAHAKLTDETFTAYGVAGEPCTTKIKELHQVAVHCSGGIYERDAIASESKEDLDETQMVVAAGIVYLVGELEKGLRWPRLRANGRRNAASIHRR